MNPNLDGAVLLGLPQPPPGSLTARLAHDVWWTECGYIRVVNERTGFYDSIDVERFKHRVDAVREMVLKSRDQGKTIVEGKLYRNMKRFVEQAGQLIRTCLETVDRSDASSVNAHRARRPVAMPVGVSLADHAAFSL